MRQQKASLTSPQASVWALQRGEALPGLAPGPWPTWVGDVLPFLLVVRGGFGRQVGPERESGAGAHSGAGEVLPTSLFPALLHLVLYGVGFSACRDVGQRVVFVFKNGCVCGGGGHFSNLVLGT